MARAYSQDLRDRVLASSSGGLSARGAAGRFGIGVKTAIEWVRRQRETGETAARRQGQPRGAKLDAHEAYLLGLVDETADITLLEMQARLLGEQGISAGIGTLSRFFTLREMTFKKNSSRGRAGSCGRRDRP